MRYRIVRGGPARRFVFDRTARAAVPKLSASLENPYWRCYGAPRTREQLRQNWNRAQK